ncbi:MAG: hypothetical protein JO021_06340 [Alphaproteobacteria bacterium]|nr:hypothetical protein [Alphaproteobacteria bacterium]
MHRSRSHAAFQLAVGAAFLALALLALVQGYLGGQASRSQLLAGLFFAAVLGVYVWQLATQLGDKRPLLVVTPEGLDLAAAAPNGPIPWSRIRRMICRPALLGRGRLDFAVDPETYASLKLGSRIFGDAIVRRSAARGEFAVMMQAGDHSALDVFGAMRRYWRPSE